MRGLVHSSTLVVLVVLVLALALGLTACTSADGEVTGGELRPGFDAATPPPVAAEFPNASPTSWHGLYRDFFSPNAESGCARLEGCHGVAGKGGALVSNFVCSDVDECYRTLRTGKHPAEKVALVEDSAIADPDSAFLFRVIRLRTPDGQVQQNRGMPLQPSDFVFSADEIGRMKQWIRNGATKD